MFKQNKYTLWYYNIIQAAMSRKSLDIYTEFHHIIPKCMGGSDESTNLVSLTAREHFICHRLLVKMTEGHIKSKLSFAVQAMAMSNRYQNRNIKITSRTYQNIRELCSQAMKDLWKDEEFRQKMIMKTKERWKDEEYKQKMIAQSKTNWKDPEYRKKVTTAIMEYWKDPENRMKQSKTQLEINKCPEVRAKKSNPRSLNGMYGKTHTNEIKQKLSQHATKRFKNKSYEDLYGKDKANQLKQKRSEDMKRIRSGQDLSGTKNPNAKSVHIKGYDFNLASDAAKYFGVGRSAISYWIKTRDDCYHL